VAKAEGRAAEALLTTRVTANLEDRSEEHEAFLKNRFRSFYGAAQAAEHAADTAGPELQTATAFRENP
jgi:hypothetical protein